MKAREVACPKCGAKPGEQCKTKNGYLYRWGNYIHWARLDAAYAAKQEKR